MSYYLIDCSQNTYDFDFDNVIIGRKIKFENISKYYLYYQTDEKEPPKEIYIKLPKIRTIYNLGNNKYNQLSIPIYPNYNLTNNFIKFIIKLETNIKECFIDKFPKMEFISILNKKNNLNFLKVKVNEKIKITSNINKENITISDFQLNSQLDIVIKLSYIWNKNDDKLSLSSEIYQIKYYASPNELDINFIDTEIEYKPKYKIIEKSEIINNSQTQLPPQIKIGVIPSREELNKAIQKLKKNKI